MKDQLLQEICDMLLSINVSDISKSITNTEDMPRVDSGFIRLLSRLPETNLEAIVDFLNVNKDISTTMQLFSHLKDIGLLDFRPYYMEFDTIGHALVCSINRVIVFDNFQFKVLTDTDLKSVISVSRGNIGILVNRLNGDISTDCYNAIIAELICTSYMCPNLRNEICSNGACVTEFMRSILPDIKAAPIYSIDTFRSKISWVNLIHQHNQNFTLENTYNISIGSDGVTIEYISPFETIEHTSFVFETEKLDEYDSQFGVRSIYFAYALYLLVSDVFNTEFPHGLCTGITYKQIDDILDLYRM